MVTHRTTNSDQPQNFARSAMAPEISAGVITANISWNITKASTGSASGPGHGTAAWVSVAATAKPARWPHVFDMPALEKLPISPPNASLENDSPNPYRIHSTDTIARQMKFIMSMFRTLFARTMPP